MSEEKKRVLVVTRRNTSSSVRVAVVDTPEEALSAALEHYSSTPKRGKFTYTVNENGLHYMDGEPWLMCDGKGYRAVYTKQDLAAMTVRS